MAEPLRRILGVNGVARNESHKAQQVSRIYEWIMFVIALCLPFYFYFFFKFGVPHFVELIFRWGIWSTFVTEWLVLTTLVRNKSFYIRTNWLNLIIIVLTFPHLLAVSKFFSAFWFARFAVVFRILFSWLDKQKAFLAKNQIFYTLIVCTSVCLVAGASVSLFDPGIKDPFTGIWWAVQTITTVGYGDTIPKTLLGRSIAILLMLMGIALITILTANFSAYLLASRQAEADQRQEVDNQQLSQQLHDIAHRLDAIEKKIEEFRRR